MPTLPVIYNSKGISGNYDLLRPPPLQRPKRTEGVSQMEKETNLTSAEKLRRAVSLIAEVRTDEKIREQGLENDLAFAQELLTSLAKGESIEQYMPKEIPEREYFSVRPGEQMTSYNGNLLYRPGDMMPRM